MPTYEYKVRDKTGKVLRGRLVATDGRELRKKLDELGYFIIEYFEKKSTRVLSSDFISFTKSVTLEDISLFSWQLYTMLNAGITLTNALKIFQQQTKNSALRSALEEIGLRIEEGMSFSDALRQHPHIFSKLYVQMVNTGEVGGVLDEMLKRMALYYEEQAQIRDRVRLALIYPSFLLVISLSVIIFLIVFVLPKFKLVFQDMGVTIPWTTQILLNTSFYLKKFWFMLPLGLGAVYIAAVAFFKTGKGRYMIDEWQIKLPIIGDLFKKVLAARFTHTLSILVSAGIPIITSLEVVTDVIDNKVVVKILKLVTTMVGEGKSIARPLGDSGIFPEMVINMIRVGEETGNLDGMLEKIAQFYHREVDNALQTFTRLIEPCMIVFMTFIVGFIAISIFLPMGDLLQSVHR